MESIVVAGAGLAAAKAVEALRSEGYQGRLTLIGQEAYLPYERPPLSKGYLLGDDERDSVFVQPDSWYADNDIDLRLGATVDRIDPVARTVSVGSTTTAFDKLLIATGSSPRTLSLTDRSGAPTAYLRTIDDSDRLKAAFQPGARIAIVGAGWIGLETAAAARRADAQVTVIEQAEAPLLRVLGVEVARLFEALHRSHGVDMRLGASIASIQADGTITLGDGETVQADLIVVGIGVTPNVGLAESAGLDVDNGILVDATLRSSHPDIYAAGDVANHLHPVLGRRIRVEHWDAAINQGTAAAKNMLGAGEEYTTLPYFFTDQYSLGMEYVGSAGSDDEARIVGDPDPEKLDSEAFRVFWLSGGKVVAGMHANDWDAIDGIREAVATGTLPEGVDR